VLSKTEKEYILGKYTPNKNYKRFLDHKIKKKIKKFYVNELPLIQNSSVSDFANTVSNFTNNNLIAEGTRSPFSEGKWSLERGTNPRPNAYEAFALPG
jgi:hypothetical protein